MKLPLREISQTALQNDIQIPEISADVTFKIEGQKLTLTSSGGTGQYTYVENGKFLQVLGTDPDSYALDYIESINIESFTRRIFASDTEENGSVLCYVAVYQLTE